MSPEVIEITVEPERKRESNDQRRTLYSFFTFVLSSTGQAILGTDNYTALPSTWLPALQTGFQSNF